MERLSAQQKEQPIHNRTEMSNRQIEIPIFNTAFLYNLVKERHDIEQKRMLVIKKTIK